MFLRIAEWLIGFRRRSAVVRQARDGRPKSILLVELTKLGDALTALPAVNAIRTTYPNAEIHWIVRETYVGFLGLAAPSVTIHGTSERSSLRALFQSLRISRGTQWGLACSLGPGRLNGLAVLLSRANAIAGFLECSGSKTPFLRNNPVSVLGPGDRKQASYSNEPLAVRSLKICEVLGIPTTTEGHLSLADKVRPLILARRNGDPPIRPSIVFHPFAGWEYRMWKAERWVELAERLADHGRRTVIILGQARESTELEAYRAMITGLAGITVVRVHDLLEAAKAIAEAALFIGCDSGPLHLATFLGVQSIGLYGPAEPGVTRPAWSRSVDFHSIYHRVECSPCNQLRCVRPHSSCMALISVEEVEDAALTILGSVHKSMVAPHD